MARRKTIDLVTALRPQATLIAQATAARLPDPGFWKGYTAAEGLDGYISNNTDKFEVTYTRKINPQATLILSFINIDEFETIHETLPVPVPGSEEILERYDREYNIPAGVKDTQVIKHTFSKTVTESKAIEDAWHAEAKAYLGWDSGSVGGPKLGVEASAGFSEKVTDTATTSETNTDEVSSTLEVTGPANFIIEFVRSRAKLQKHRIVKATEFTYKWYMYTGETTWEAIFPRDFVRLIRGQLSPNADPTNQAPYYAAKPMTEEEVDAILEASNSESEIDLVYQYDNVNYIKTWQLPGTQRLPQENDNG